MKTCLHNSLISVSSNGDKCHERGRKSVYVGNVAVILRRGFCSGTITLVCQGDANPNPPFLVLQVEGHDYWV